MIFNLLYQKAVQAALVGMKWAGGMMNSLFLNKDEMVVLTGKVRAKPQIRALAELRIPFLVNAAGRPIVARAAVERVLGAVVVPTQSPESVRWKSHQTDG
ncbi:DUF4224 domain-containing protein [Kingella kingae]|uniref:DUF4224 domain-containing protein n=1 Tax=Kingella kingae TaxID=504 RepID=UPI000407F3DD|nr:DUF4224 domain-containing protein [Kingella kingae]